MPSAHTAADSLQLAASGVEILHLAAVGTVPGVAPLLAAGRNGPGAGRIRTSAAGSLQYKAPDRETWGPAVGVSVDAAELLLVDGTDPGQWLRVAAWPDYLVPGAESRVLLGDRYENGATAGDATADEAAAGDVAAYQIELTNQSGRTVEQLVAWLDADTAGVELSDDGLSWVAPTTESAGLALASLATGESATLYLRRTIALGASADTAVLDVIHFAFDGL